MAHLNRIFNAINLDDLDKVKSFNFFGSDNEEHEHFAENGNNKCLLHALLLGRYNITDFIIEEEKITELINPKNIMFELLEKEKYMSVHYLICKKLIKYDTRYKNGDTILHLLVRKIDFDINWWNFFNKLGFKLEKLINIKNDLGHTPLTTLMYFEKFIFERVVFLISKKSNVVVYDNNKNTPLMILLNNFNLSDEDKVKIIKYLAEKVYITFEQKESSLHSNKNGDFPMLLLAKEYHRHDDVTHRINASNELQKIVPIKFYNKYMIDKLYIVLLQDNSFFKIDILRYLKKIKIFPSERISKYYDYMNQECVKEIYPDYIFKDKKIISVGQETHKDSIIKQRIELNYDTIEELINDNGNRIHVEVLVSILSNNRKDFLELLLWKNTEIYFYRSSCSMLHAEYLKKINLDFLKYFLDNFPMVYEHNPTNIILDLSSIDPRFCPDYEKKIDIILNHKLANVNIFDKDFKTPLHKSVYNEREYLTKKLLKKKASKYSFDNEAKTPMDYAIKYSNEKMKHILNKSSYFL